MSRVLSNEAAQLERVSKAVLTKSGLLEIRRGTLTFPRGAQEKPNTWASKAEWHKFLLEKGWPLPVARRLDFQEPLPVTPQPSQPSTEPTKTMTPYRGTMAYVDGLTVGTILGNTDGTSKVGITKDRSLIELRRGEITWWIGQKAPRHTWSTLNQWKAFLESEGMNSELMVVKHKKAGLFDFTGCLVTELEQPGAPARTEETLPSPETQPQLQLTRQTGEQQAVNMRVEKIRAQILLELRKDIDELIMKFVNEKLKMA
jgi:hypothetical protein